MKLKASLHIHTKEDLSDGRVISYDIFKLIDQAKKYKFQVLALTCHRSLATQDSFVKNARARDILLIGGIELELIEGSRRPHVVVLNAEADIMKVKTLSDLKKYKKNHSAIFVLAPHANSGSRWSLGLKNLVAHIDIFDAVEHTWFYSAWFNSNKAVAKVAKIFNKPLVATGDIHCLKYLNTDYTIIDAPKLETASIFQALKAGRVNNVTRAKGLGEMFLFLMRFFVWANILTLCGFSGKNHKS